jgi:hypothetical protein
VSLHGQFGERCATTIGKPSWTPEGHDTLVGWCTDKPKNMRVIITLVLWELWKHRNAIVFDGASPSLVGLIKRIVEEGNVWFRAGLIKGDWNDVAAELSRWARGE